MTADEPGIYVVSLSDNDGCRWIDSVHLDAETLRQRTDEITAMVRRGEWDSLSYGGVGIYPIGRKADFPDDVMQA